MKLMQPLHKFGRSILIVLAVCQAFAQVSGQVWTEIGDAGDYVTNAQLTAGVGALTQIKGTCLIGDRDLYMIAVTNAAIFKAAVTAPSGNDTLMGLFDTNGMGVAFNDDTPVPYNGLSTLDFSKNGLPLSNGLYILGLMSSGQMWTSDAGNIWNRQPWDDQRAPDGEGKDLPMTGYWGTAEHDVVNYIIQLTGASFAKSGLPPKIDRSPDNLSVDEGQPASFSVAASGSQPLAYQWQVSTDGGSSYSNLAGATNIGYGFLVVHPAADNQKRVRVVVSNALGSATSSAATLTVKPDVVAPTVVFAGTLGHPTAIVVEFSEPVDDRTALAATNYALPGVVITNLSRVSLTQIVLRSSSSVGTGSLTIHDVLDLADARNVVSPSPTTIALDTKMHGVTMRKFDGIAGTTLDTLYASPSYPNSPDTVQYLPTLETPSNIDDNYGAVLLGYVVPPVSGDYTFYIASDDNGELLLSPDENPANAIQIAYEPNYDTARNWQGRPELQSTPQSLLAGRRYYFQAAMKEGGGDDNLAVTWVKPGETIQAGQAPIRNQYLLPYGSVTGGDPQIARQPTGSTVNVGAMVTLSALVTGSPPFAYGWYRNGMVLPGANQPVLKFTADHSSAGTYRLSASNLFGATLSDQATVKVQNPAGLWIEEGDAGDTLTTAQVVVGSGPLNQIQGTIPDGWDHDLYKIMVTNYASFSARVTAPENGNSRLALFDGNGMGLVMNDDASDGMTLSAIDYATSKLPASNGVHYLGIMTQVEMPASTVNGTNAYIWTADNPTAQKRPDGPGASSPLVGFGGYGGSLANYTIALTGAAFLPEPVVPSAVGLTIQRNGSSVVLAWSSGAEADGFALQETDQLSPAANWRPTSATPVVAGSQMTVTIAPSGTAKFYRLAHP